MGRTTKLKRYANHCTESPRDKLRGRCLGGGPRVVGILSENLMFIYQYVSIKRKGFCIRRSLLFQTSVSTRVTSLSFAKIWIYILVALTFNTFQ